MNLSLSRGESGQSAAGHVGKAGGPESGRVLLMCPPAL